MKPLIRIIFCTLVLTAPTMTVAQEASGRINLQADSVALEWVVVPSPPRDTPNENGEPMRSVFAPQSEQFEGVDMLVAYGTPTAGSADLLMLAVYQRVSGQPSFVDQYFKGFLYYYPEGQDGGWVSDFAAPGSELVVDAYEVSENLATASGHFTTTAYFEPEDADEPDKSRAMALSGTFAWQLPRLEE